MIDAELVAHLEGEFDEGFVGKLVPQAAYAADFSAMGFETTFKFRQDFWLINKAFLRRGGRYWSPTIFRDEFCKAQHFLLNIPGIGVKRFAVVMGHPVEYRKQKGKKPLLVDIGSWRGKFVSTLEKRGQAVKIPYRPCGLPRHSVGRGLVIAGKSELHKLFPQLFP